MLDLIGDFIIDADSWIENIQNYMDDRYQGKLCWLIFLPRTSFGMGWTSFDFLSHCSNFLFKILSMGKENQEKI